jgi:hypothetical protein
MISFGDGSTVSNTISRKLRKVGLLDLHIQIFGEILMDVVDGLLVVYDVSLRKLASPKPASSLS